MDVHSSHLGLRLSAIALIMLAMPGSAIISPTLAQDQSASLQGRWREATGAQPPPGHAALGIIDFFPCGSDAICGRKVSSDGACGPIVMRLSVSGRTSGNAEKPALIYYSGKLTGLGKDAEMTGESSASAFRMRAVTPGFAIMSRQAMPYYVSAFNRIGPAKCTQGPIS